MTQEIILPAEAQKIVTSYTQYALPLSVLCPHPQLTPWIIKEFSKIKSEKKISKNGNHMHYFLDDSTNNNFLQVNYHNLMEIQAAKWSSIDSPIEFLESSISNGYYIHSEMDESKIMIKSVGKRRFVHPSLIYGYSSRQKKVFAIGFVKKQFCHFEFSYNEFINSIKPKKLFFPFEKSNSRKSLNLYIYKILPINNTYYLDIQDFKDILKSQIVEQEDNAWLYGPNCYQPLLNNLKLPATKGLHLKYHTIHFLSDHKKMILKAWQHISSLYKDEIDSKKYAQQLIDVSKAFENIRFSFIDHMSKNNFDPIISDKETAISFHSSINKAINLEQEVFYNILSKLDSIN